MLLTGETVSAEDAHRWALSIAWYPGKEREEPWILPARSLANPAIVKSARGFHRQAEMDRLKPIGTCLKSWSGDDTGCAGPERLIDKREPAGGPLMVLRSGIDCRTLACMVAAGSAWD
jgi:hypothetical protein